MAPLSSRDLGAFALSNQVALKNAGDFFEIKSGCPRLSAAVWIRQHHNHKGGH